jgi:hypothetical protein
VFVFLIVCDLETSKRGDSRPRLGCSATGNKKRKKIHTHKSCDETLGQADTQRVNVLVLVMSDVMNGQLMEGMIMV